MGYHVTMRRASGQDIARLIDEAKTSPRHRRRIFGIPFGPVLDHGLDRLIAWIEAGQGGPDFLDIGYASLPLHTTMITNAEASERVWTPLIDAPAVQKGILHLDAVGIAEMHMRMSVVDKSLARARLMEPYDGPSEAWSTEPESIKPLLATFAAFKTFIAETRAARMEIVCRQA